MDAIAKKKLWIYIAVAYGVTAIMTLLMYFALKKEYDLTCFVNTQMIYPACGVILGRLICRKEGEHLPLGGYITVLATTAVMVICSICSLFCHITPIDMNGTEVDVWNLISSVPITIGSIIAYIFFWVCGKEKRENAGVERRNILWSIILIAAFVVLLFARMLIGVCIEDAIGHTHENMEQFKTVLTTPLTWITSAILPINFFLTFIAFFGEEYGWRYYLQPVLQKKFGKRCGVLLLGLVWAVWHIGVDFMFYTTEYGVQAFVGQIITCVAMAIFLGFAYMKTQNIWVPVIIHYLNNNIAALLQGGGTEALQNQVIPWSALPIMAVSAIVFVLFILMPIYNQSAEYKLSAD